MKYYKKVVEILIYFWTLNPAQNIVQIENVKVEVLSQILHILFGRLLDVNPG
jgi:hypothetical protein